MVHVLLHKMGRCLSTEVALDRLILQLSNLSHKPRKAWIHKAKSRDEVRLLKQLLPACCDESCWLRFELVECMWACKAVSAQESVSLSPESSVFWVSADAYNCAFYFQGPNVSQLGTNTQMFPWAARYVSP